MTEKTGAPPCGLYYRLDQHRDIPRDHGTFLRDIRQIAMVINRNSGYERNMFIIEINVNAFNDAAHIETYIQATQDSGGVAVLRGAKIENVGDADGIFLEKHGDLAKARAALNNDTILGVSCGDLQDIAQNALSGGADFVSFGIENYGLPDIKMLQWWADTTHGDIPALALGALDSNNCGLLAHSGAGFVDVTTYLNEHPRGIVQATVNILDALAQADE